MPSLSPPLFAFLFASPLTAVAAGAAAVSIPVIIHLLSRRRYKVVTWAAMRFLLAAQKQSTRRLRLEQVLLLATRCLLLLLLVLAMASVTPWAEALWYKLFPDSAVLAATGGQRTHKILVLDGSFSMALKAGDQTCFERAKARAAQIVDNAPGGDAFSVVLMAAPGQRIVAEPSEDRGRVNEEIRHLRLPHGNADVPGMLHIVDGMLRDSPGKMEAREVYFLTDMQKSTWTGLPGSQVADLMKRIQDRARVAFVDVGQGSPANAAVSSLTLGSPLATTGTEITVTATVHNYEASEPRTLKAELLVGKARTAATESAFDLRSAGQEPLVVPPGRNGVTVTFKHTFTTPGDYVVQVRLENDALELDDSRSLVVTVKDTVPVLLVNGKPAPEPLDQATHFLRAALNPYRGLTPRNVPVRPKVVTEAQFADAALGDLTPYDCVFLCDVARIGSGEVRRLENHLRQGGGVVFCLGPNVDLEAYNRLLYRNGDGLLPARLLSTQRAPEGRVFTFYADGDQAFRKPPLEAFAADADRLSLLSARFRQYVRAELPPKNRARKVLSFMPEPIKPDAPRKEPEADPKGAMPVGDPAVIDWPRYRGRVALLTTTANMDWTSWPASPSYVSFMQELLRYAVAGRLHDQASLVGEPLEQYLPAGSAGLEVAVVTPDGRNERTQTIAQDDAVVLRFTDTDQSGIYRVTLGQHPREHLFAVNVPTATEAQQACESDLARVNKGDLQGAYPQWDFQVVTDPKDVVRALPTSGPDGPAILRGMGAVIARVLLFALFALVMIEALLAWRLGHHSKTVVAGQAPPAEGKLLPVAVGMVAGLAFLVVAGVLIHTAWTRDFLGFLPDRARHEVEQALGVPEPVAGESTRWRLEYTPYLLRDAALEPWLIGAIAVACVALIGFVYYGEGRTAGGGYRVLLAGLRVFLILLVLAVLLPQLQLWFERQGWPDIAVIIDDSKSMSAVDQYRDPKVQQAADKLATLAELSEPQRLRLAQALLAHPSSDWLNELITRRKVKVHVYHCSNRAARLAAVTGPDQRDAAVKAIQALQPEGDTSQLGGAVRQVLTDFRGSSLAAIVMLTDGVTTEGEDLLHASRHAAQSGVPLYFVGLGDSHDVRDLIVHDVQAEDTVFVNDRLVFEGRLTAQGYEGLPPVLVELYEKDADGQLKKPPLAGLRVAPDPQGKPVKFRLTHRPTKAGEKQYVVKAEELRDEVQHDNNLVERTVHVREAKPSRVLYIEGYPRSEFRFVKMLLEREASQAGNKSVELKVLLLDAQDDWHLQDKSARPDFPTKEELNQFDVVILGDVDLKHPKMGDKNVRLLVDFVRERGGGLLALAGKRDNPRSYKDSPLADVLPIQIASAAPLEDPDGGRAEGYRPVLTSLGRMHPIFRFSPDEVENTAIWNKLSEMYWFAEGYRLQPLAEVLAVHPTKRALDPGRPGAGGDDRHPLVVQQFVGAGRCLFLGFDETWAWGFREDQIRFNQFWIQTVNYLARNRLGRIDLRLDRQTPYRRGEPIKVMVRFPDDQPPPPAGSEVKALVERRPLPNGLGGDTEVQTMQLAKIEGSRATYEGTLTRTPEGEYRFWLSTPTPTGPRPRAEARVLPPPGEMERLRMNQADMERAAEETHGKFYTLADAPKLLDDLPTGSRIVTSTPGPPWLLWNHIAMFGLIVGLLGTEWIMRKRKHLL